MKMKVLANTRNQTGQILGGQYQTITEVDENIEVNLSWVAFNQIRGIWRLEITRNGVHWFKVYLSDSQLRKLKAKMDHKDDSHIICPSKEAVPWPLGEAAEFVLTCTSEGKLEIVNDATWHMFILDFDGDQLRACEARWFSERERSLINQEEKQKAGEHVIPEFRSPSQGEEFYDIEAFNRCHIKVPITEHPQWVLPMLLGLGAGLTNIKSVDYFTKQYGDGFKEAVWDEYRRGGGK